MPFKRSFPAELYVLIAYRQPAQVHIGSHSLKIKIVRCIHFTVQLQRCGKGLHQNIIQPQSAIVIYISPRYSIYQISFYAAVRHVDGSFYTKVRHGTGNMHMVRQVPRSFQVSL